MPTSPGSLSPSPGVAAAEQALQAIADLCLAGRDPAKAPALPSVLRQCALLATQCLDGAAPLAVFAAWISSNRCEPWRA